MRLLYEPPPPRPSKSLLLSFVIGRIGFVVNDRRTTSPRARKPTHCKVSTNNSRSACHALLLFLLLLPPPSPPLPPIAVEKISSYSVDHPNRSAVDPHQESRSALGPPSPLLWLSPSTVEAVPARWLVVPRINPE